MIGHKAKSAATAAAFLLVLAGCSSSKPTGAAGNSGATNTTANGQAKETVTVGVLVDETGPGSVNKAAVQGFQAGVAWAAAQGYKINYDVVDTATSPSGAVAGAQRMIEQEHVQAVIAASALTFAAAPYLTAHHIPVIGAAEDASEWLTDKNMFSVIGTPNDQLVPSDFGQLMKMEGGTNLGSIGYSISPGSSEAAKGAGVSAQAAGLKAGYVNAAFPFGSTNVGPVVLAMKTAGIDSFTSATDPNTAFAFITSLKQQGVNLKFALLDDGYGSDLLQSGPGAAQAAQGLDFEVPAEPVEMHTSATQQFSQYLRDAGASGEPDFAEYIGYLSALLLVQTLKAAGPNPTSATILSALSGIDSFAGGGLYGPQSLNINNRTGSGSGVLNCVYVTKFVGSAFDLVPGADPICGHILAGKSVSASS
jgi:ABC-type branched-subunit amino acid transport system substrate-binding protein